MDLFAILKRHPEVIGLAVVIVAIVAWYQSRGTSSGSGSGDVTFTGGGVSAANVDPGVVSMEQSRIEAGTQNLGTIAQLVLGEQQSSDALEAVHTQADAALSADLARTGATRDVGLAQTEAQRQASLAQTQAGIDIASLQSSAYVTAAEIAAQITSQTQAAISASNIRIAELERDQAATASATQRDVARVQSKSSFWGDLFDFGGNVVNSIFGGLF